MQYSVLSIAEPGTQKQMKSLLKIIAKIGRISRYIGIVAFFTAIAFSKFNLAGIIGFFVFFASFIFRTDEKGENPMERRSFFEKIFGLDPDE